MLDDLVKLGLQNNLIGLSRSIPRKDYPKIFYYSHNIKGNVSWVGCGHVHKAATDIQDAWI